MNWETLHNQSQYLALSSNGIISLAGMLKDVAIKVAFCNCKSIIYPGGNYESFSKFRESIM
jgi:hypothetical protein